MKREDFTGDDPWCRTCKLVSTSELADRGALLTPEHGEEEDLNDGKCDEQLTAPDVAGGQLVIRSTGGGEEEVTAKTSDESTNDFAHTSVEQHLSSTHSFNQPQSGNTSDKGDHACTWICQLQYWQGTSETYPR